MFVLQILLEVLIVIIDTMHYLKVNCMEQPLFNTTTTRIESACNNFVSTSADFTSHIC